MRETSATTVLCVDDHAVVRAGLRALLDAQPYMRVVGEAADPDTALARARALRPDLVVMDLRLGADDGVDAIRAILSDLPHTRVLVLSSYSGDETIHRAFDAGARGFVLKEFAADEIIAAVRVVASGGRYLSAAVAGRIMAHGPRVALTDREREVLGMMADGEQNKIIGHRLGISEATARTHVQNILQKLGCDNRGRAVAVAIARGMLNV